MKIALIKTKPQKSNHHQVYNRNQQQQEYREIETAERVNTKKQEVKMETHLTVIGVCTTIRPEKSGT